MNRLVGLAIALVLGLWAQRTLTGPEPGIPRDALILFVLAGIAFAWSGLPPRPLREATWMAPASAAKPWRRSGRALSLAGVAVGLVALVLLWGDLQGVLGLVLWPLAAMMVVAGAFLEDRSPGQTGNELELREQGKRVSTPTSVRPADAESAGTGRPSEAEMRYAARVDRPARRPPPSTWLAEHWDLLALLVIIVVAAVVRFNQLDVYPNGCQSDECNNGLDALKWLRGSPYIPYAETNEGQATLFTYLIALSFRLFGVGVTQMRLVSAAVGVITVVAFYILARDLYGRKPALVAAALLATARWHVTFSRIVYELIMQPLFMILLCLFLLRGLRTGHRRYWALAGVALAVGMNTYTAFRVVPFLVAAFLAFWVFRSLIAARRQGPSPQLSDEQGPPIPSLEAASVTGDKGERESQLSPRLPSVTSEGSVVSEERSLSWQPGLQLRRDLEGMALMVAAAFTAVLPLGVYIVQNWEVFTSRIRHISVFEDVDRVGSLQPVLENLRKTLYMFNWQGDNAALNNLPGAPMLDTIVAVLFVLGMAYSVWYALRARAIPMLYVLWFLAIASLAVLSVAHEAPTARRTIGMIPLVYLLVALFADQLFRIWSLAWGGLGRRALAVAVGVAVVVIAVGNARAYFQEQAPHPDVWNAYSPSESAVGRFLATLPQDVTVLITPQYEHHSAIKLMSQSAADQQPSGGEAGRVEGTASYRALNPVADLPYRGESGGANGSLGKQDLVYVLEPVDEPLMTLLAQIYPGGQAEEHLDRYGRPLFLSYQVPASEVARTQGLVGEYYGTYPPTEAAEAIDRAQVLDLDLREAPLPQPFFVIWEGTLLVPSQGQYTFELLAEAEAASLQIGRELQLDTNAVNSRGVLTETLAGGFHPFRLEVRSGDQPGQVRLTWSREGAEPQVLGGDALFVFDLGDQGLVGYYYPNMEWQGPPALVRRDLLVVPNNALPEPFSIRWRGKLAAPRSGSYIIGTRSDDGSFVFVDGQLVVDNGGVHGAQDRQGTIQLAEGFHDIEVRYFDVGGSREMQLWWQPPGEGRAVIDSAYLFPLEGPELPEGLALPPPPDIDIIPDQELAPESEDTPGMGVPAEPAAPGVEVPPIRVSGEFAALPAEVAWTYGTCGTGDEQLSSPRGVAVDPATGDIYAADTGNNRIVHLSPAGDFVDSWGQPGEGASQFQEPMDLVSEPKGTILVLDAVAQRLLRFSEDGRFLETFGDDLSFYRPRGLGVDPAGQLVVADTGGVRMVRLDPAGAAIGEVGGRDQVGDGGLAAMQPTDAAVTMDGDLYFVEAENGVITWITSLGEVTRWSGPVPASTLDGPHLALGSVALSQTPALASNSVLLATDPEGRRVLVFDLAGTPLGQFGSDAGLLKPVGIGAGPARGEGEALLVVVADAQACQIVAFELRQTE